MLGELSPIKSICSILWWSESYKFIAGTLMYYWREFSRLWFWFEGRPTNCLIFLGTVYLLARWACALMISSIEPNLSIIFWWWLWHWAAERVCMAFSIMTLILIHLRYSWLRSKRDRFLIKKLIYFLSSTLFQLYSGFIEFLGFALGLYY